MRDNPELAAEIEAKIKEAMATKIIKKKTSNN
jgi:hypothetical protein